MDQLNLFDYANSIMSQSIKKRRLKPGKPHRDVSIQPNGDILYKGNIGWFRNNKELAMEWGYIDEWQPTEDDYLD